MSKVSLRGDFFCLIGTVLDGVIFGGFVLLLAPHATQLVFAVVVFFGAMIGGLSGYVIEERI